MADAGRAMMLYRGMYDSTHTYEKLDVVNHNGSLYISTTDGNLGTEPTDGTKWKLFLQGGVADKIQATDTYGLVGTKGDSSFVQLLLDSLASRIQGVTLNRQTLGYSKKNLLKNTATSTTNNGVTFTVNDDGSVTANGTATGDSVKTLGMFVPIPNTEYIFTGNEKVNDSGYSNNICFIDGIDGSDTWHAGAVDEKKYIFTPKTNAKITCRISIKEGTHVDNLTFYPMIRSADITDGTYEPYVDDVDTRLQKIDNSILNTLEEIDANTSEGNIAGALAVKSLNSNLTNSLDALTNNVNNYKYKELWNGRTNSGETITFTADINELNWRSLLIAFYYSSMNAIAFCTLPKEFCDVESNIRMPIAFLNEITTVATVPHVYNNTLTLSWDNTNFKLYKIFAELN